MRFEVHAPIRYRSDDGRWQTGWTENISRSGVLLHAAEALTPNSAVEMVVELPPVIAGEPSATMVCRGRVVRTIAGQLDGAVVAAEITHYTFGRCESDLPAATET
jgi:hypothetical protein